MPLYSSQWFRVARLVPSLPASVRLHRHRVRGHTWQVLTDPLHGRQVRLNPPAHALAARLDGRRTVDELWQALQALGDDAPTQDETLALLMTLHRERLVRFDHEPDFGLAGAVAPPTHAGPWRGASGPAGRLLAWRLRLGDPSWLLSRLAGLGRALFSRAGAVAWLAAMALLVAIVALHGGPAATQAQAWLGEPRHWLLALAVYLPMKAVHELAHGLAAQRWGAPVREAGITLMLGLPLPYVDASAASALPRAGQRALVSGAGIAAELLLAAAGWALWALLDDGLARDLALAVAFIGTASSLLFNGNPLQRFDGYHLLCDALQLPNLATRSRAWWAARLRQAVLGRHAAAEPLQAAPGEAPWLVLHAPAALLWMVGVTLGLAAWLGRAHPLLGLLAATVLGVHTLRPLAGGAWRLWRAACTGMGGTAGTEGVGDGGGRRLGRAAALLGGPLVVLAALPLPQQAVLPGVVWADEQAALRTPTAGFVETVWARDGQAVAAGQPVLRLANPGLQARRAAVAARLEQAQHARYGGWALDEGAPAQPAAAQAEEDLARLSQELRQLDDELDGLVIRARRAGRLVLPRGADLPGRHLPRGHLLGQVLDANAPTTLRVALPQSQAVVVRQALAEALAEAPAEERRHPAPATPGTRQTGAAPQGRPTPAATPAAAPDATWSPRLSARVADEPATPRRAALLADAAGATPDLPSPALAERHGGPLRTAPSDPEGRRAAEPLVALDVRIDRPAGALLGQRAWLRVDLGHAPALVQAGRAAWQAWRRAFRAEDGR